ncbi:GNAT family N-acetyltransferase [Verrucosispora sp. WMMA2044]|uniref:GNAT family N-acetyltransferase n=1 Tax=Verrucosispora sp. WMMA2044 TaxID=3016419 RepID=UPI00248BC61B|nr:GNAT family N-acetyltransferase [Verrucosispora sp. WMMA2044]WBB47428.1 GNAT family N-acetyltransferase [Verrucosispora sp. WMMA2044]
MIANLVLQTYATDEAEKLVDELVSLYLEVHADEGEFYSEERYLRQLGAHRERNGWQLVTATVNGVLIAYIYGFPLPPQTRWWEGLNGDVPAGFTDEDGRRTFAISELLVRAGWRRKGVARALHDRLLSGRTEQRATLLVRPDNAIARRAYDSWGWRQQARLRPSWENAPEFLVLTTDLPHPTASSTVRACE